MQCDVRACHEDEKIPLFKTMLSDKPVKVWWDDSDRHIIYKKGRCELRVWMRVTGYTTFEFYTGIDNIRFDGRLNNSFLIKLLKTHSKHGEGTRVGDFIDLTGEDNG